MIEEQIEMVLRTLHSQRLPYYPLLLVFFTGGTAPPDCVAMPRDPTPVGGFSFDEEFSERLHEAMLANASAHDGAVAFGRTIASGPYRCVGWSYRIVAAGIARGVDTNRGSAYNSAVSLSLSPGIDGVCLFSPSMVEVFADGRRKELAGG